jgi:hypothetical protein
VSTPGSEQSRQHDLPLPKVPKEAILVSRNPEYRGMVWKLIASKRGLLGLKQADAGNRAAAYLADTFNFNAISSRDRRCGSSVPSGEPSRIGRCGRMSVWPAFILVSPRDNLN